jgi:hypothetical protein
MLSVVCVYSMVCIGVLIVCLYFVFVSEPSCGEIRTHDLIVLDFSHAVPCSANIDSKTWWLVLLLGVELTSGSDWYIIKLSSSRLIKFASYPVCPLFKPRPRHRDQLYWVFFVFLSFCTQLIIPRVRTWQLPSVYLPVHNIIWCCIV